MPGNEPLTSSKQHVGVLTIVSMIFPGLGHVYNGEAKKGYFFLIEIIVGLFPFFIPGFMVWLYSVYNSNLISRKINAGEFSRKPAQKYQIYTYFIIYLVILCLSLLFMYSLSFLMENNTAFSSVMLIFFFLFIGGLIFYYYTFYKEGKDKKTDKSLPFSTQTIETLGSISPTKEGKSTLSERRHYEDLYEPQEEERVIGEPTIIKGEKIPIDTKSGLLWAGFDQTIEIQNYPIPNAATYWSISEPSEPEACCIDTSKPIGEPSPNQPLPYWPQYSELTPEQRGYYLAWLALGKPRSINEIGYVFLYFYGLERRALIDNSDIDNIISECLNLSKKFTFSQSFNHYISEFITFLIGSEITEITDQDIRQLFPDYDLVSAKFLEMLLSWHQIKRIAIPWNLAYAVAVTSSTSFKTNVFRKKPDIFKRLYELKFKETYPDGLQLDDNEKQKQIVYQPASPTLSKQKNTFSVRLPMPGEMAIKKILSIWAECVNDLKPMNNKLFKTDGTITREVYSVIPGELKKEIQHPDQALWLNLISGIVSSEGSTLVKISDIAPLIGIEERETLTPKQSKVLESTAYDIGFTLIPTLSLLGTSYKWNDIVALFNNPDSTNPLSENIEKVALIYQMAYAIAEYDESFSEKEQDFLSSSLKDRFRLNPIDIRYLQSLNKVLEKRSPSINRIGKRLSKHLDSHQKLVLANFLSKIMFLENELGGDEEKVLKKVYKSLNIEASVADEAIHQFIATKSMEEPISVFRPTISRTGEKIPDKLPQNVITIDEMKLRQKIQETNDVKIILGEIFKQEQEETDIKNLVGSEVKDITFIPPTGIPDNTLPFSDESITSLDQRYIPVLNDILKSDEIDKEAFTDLVRNHNLMPDAVLDTINAWADEELGDFLLIEDNNVIRINRDY